MSNIKSKNHYRVAQKYDNLNKINGIFIPEDKKNKVIFTIFILMFILIIKSILIIYLLKNKK